MGKPSQRRKPKRRGRQPPARESRPAEFLTVCWLLSVLTALFCELGAAAALWYVSGRPDAKGIEALSAILMFAALLVGCFSLVLMAAVWKLRRARPPSGIMVFSTVVGLAPAAVLLLKSLL
jgi:hypothetical protein